MAGNGKPSTYFAPAGRDGPDELSRQRYLVRHTSLLQQTIDAMSDVVLILNSSRQIVGANRPLLELLSCELEDVLGKRPGELVGCKNCVLGPDGCGTASDCMLCGAVNAILESQRSDHRTSRECRITLAEPVGGALDLKVTATGIELDGEPFIICVVKDISDEKRLAVLARMFFHDVMNTAGSIQGLTELLVAEVTAEAPEIDDLRQLAELAEQLVEEVQSQRDLTYAEAGDLEPMLAAVNVPSVLQRLQAAYARHPVARGRRIELQAPWNGDVTTDGRLLNRVLGNMIKNALEATDPGGTVTVRCVDQGTRVMFSVHNPTVMAREVQMQVFQRSFSTKARMGRGIGTHSMKLFGERYLGGKVDFTSCEPDGTTFTFLLPKVSTHATN
jgi:signal transduction histidine kinase